jgi:hypothetical protein
VPVRAGVRDTAIFRAFPPIAVLVIPVSPGIS